MEQIEQLAIDAALAFAADSSERETAADADALRTERHLAMLQELAAMAMDLARAVHRQAVASAEPTSEQPAPKPAADSALAFSRIAKTVRQCLALEARVADQDRRRQLGEIGGVGELVGQAKAYRFGEKKRQVKRAVAQTIEAEAAASAISRSDAEILIDRLDARLEDELMAEDLEHRPVGECIALLCRKLGVTPDWTDWQETGWAAAEIAEKPKGSPYAGDWQTPPKRVPRPRPRNPYMDRPNDPAGPEPNRRW